MNDQEYRALLVILQRAPVSPAEMLWLNALLARLRPEAQQPAPQPAAQEPASAA